MKKLFYLALSLMLTVACSGNEDQLEQSNQALIVGKWELTKLYDLDDGEMYYYSSDSGNGYVFNSDNTGLFIEGFCEFPIYYSISGDQIKWWDAEFGKKQPIDELVEIYTIHSLTDTELVVLWHPEEPEGKGDFEYYTKVK